MFSASVQNNEFLLCIMLFVAIGNEEYQNGEIFNTARIDDQNGTTTIANNTYSDSDESPEYPHLV